MRTVIAISIFVGQLVGVAWAGGDSEVVPLREAAGERLVGTAVGFGHLSGDVVYGNVLAREFSQMTCENEMKFARIHPSPSSYAFAQPDAMVDFAQAHAMKVRGHTLVWGTQLPDWILKGGMTADQLSAALKDHITAVVSRYEGKVYAWDVVNEAFLSNGSLHSTVWYDAPGIGFAGQGTQYIEQAFRWARAADEKALLFYNDFGAEGMNKKSDAIYAMVKDFKSRGVPIDGVGLQMHLPESGISASELASNMERLTSLGVQVQITELDVSLDMIGGVATQKQLGAQAKIYRDVVAVCAANANCTGVTVWGFTDKYSWIPRHRPGMGAADIFDENYRPKPAYFAVQAALRNK